MIINHIYKDRLNVKWLLSFCACRAGAGGEGGEGRFNDVFILQRNNTVLQMFVYANTSSVNTDT